MANISSCARAIMRLIQKFIITIAGHGWNDFEDVELPELPEEGETNELSTEPAS